MVGERCVPENIVCYDDEGGGEEDTEAFDMLALRHLNTAGPGRARRPPSPAGGSGLLLPFIRGRLQQADLDSTAPPSDSLQTYAFEGSASSAASLSSLNSLGSQECQQNYDLKEWGPRFRTLADLYGQREGGGGALQPWGYTCGAETSTCPGPDSCGQPGAASHPDIIVDNPTPREADVQW